tara:strand:+ start:170 stop:802 length:633 start_codon:yes stop_codon:yes gene_type:complete
MSDVMWDIAKALDGSIYFISDECDLQLYCMECDGEMIPVKGAVNEHHFRHSVEGNCSGESHLHLSKKHKIHKIANTIGESEIEKALGKYIADVRFEKEWAFEVVVTNPPSEEKMNDLKGRLVIFNFTDGHWDKDEYCGESLEDLVLKICTHIKEETTDDWDFPVCEKCREVQGVYSKIKGNTCMSCDYDEFCKVGRATGVYSRSRNKEEE